VIAPRVAFACATALALPAAAQLRPAAHPRCVVTAHVAVAADDALDPRAPPALVALDDVLVVVWRDRAGALHGQRFAPDLRALDEPRELARPVGAFALARTPTGLALAYVERDRDLVVTRRAPTLEAQNVPRVVESLGTPVAAVALAATAGGALLAWSTSSEVRVTALDPRGVPRAPSTVALEQTGARALRLDAADPITLRVDALDPAVEPTVLMLSADGTVTTRARWPAGALGPLHLGGAALTAQINPLGSPMLLRGGALGAPAALADPAVAPRARLDDLAVDRDLVVALVSEPGGGRQSLVRLLPDGSASWLAGVRGVIAGPSTLAVRAPAAVLLLVRDTAHSPPRTVLQRYACARP
jgi:hypothetical protein